MQLTKAKAVAILVFCAKAAKALPIPDGQTYHIHPNNANFHIDGDAFSEDGYDDWRKRPYRPEPLQFLSSHEAEIVRDHDLVITPSLQTGVHFPNPLLPTDDADVKKHYFIAVGEYEKNQHMTRDEKEKALATKREEILAFNRMKICIHNWWFTRECAGLRLSRIFHLGGLTGEYQRLKKKLMGEMKVEGYVNQGRELKRAHPEDYPFFLEHTQVRIDIPYRKGRPGSQMRGQRGSHAVSYS